MDFNESGFVISIKQYFQVQIVINKTGTGNSLFFASEMDEPGDRGGTTVKRRRCTETSPERLSEDQSSKYPGIARCLCIKKYYKMK
ncbi:hypothetical protein CULT_2120010 [[Clostridium] ultunense Esp]|nr:hypothetical protein CULT_2120010 [[Clostridium] ultunense Esp]